MENNKYYTPALEEFHVGFEFEQFAPKHQNDSETYNKVACSKHILYNIVTYWKYNISEDYRVKYLDKEDIESLGWIHSIHTSNQWYLIGEDIEFTLVLYQNNEVRITDKYPNGITQSDKEDKDIFRGNIKNKSELSKLMKQLNIIK